MKRVEFIEGSVSTLIAARSVGRLAEHAQLLMTEVLTELAGSVEFTECAREASGSIIEQARRRARVAGFESAVESAFVAGVARGVAAGAVVVEDGDWVYGG